MLSARSAYRKVIGASLLVGVFGLLLVTHPGSAQSANALPANVDFADDHVALQAFQPVASAFGEASPTSVHRVSSTRGRAVAVLTGDVITNDLARPVVVIQATGDFVALHSGPAGSPHPVGRFLTVFFDAQSGMVTDTSLTETAPDLSILGSVSEVLVAS